MCVAKQCFYDRFRLHYVSLALALFLVAIPVVWPNWDSPVGIALFGAVMLAVLGMSAIWYVPHMRRRRVVRAEVRQRADIVVSDEVDQVRADAPRAEIERVWTQLAEYWRVPAAKLRHDDRLTDFLWSLEPRLPDGLGLDLLVLHGSGRAPSPRIQNDQPTLADLIWYILELEKRSGRRFREEYARAASRRK